MKYKIPKGTEVTRYCGGQHQRVVTTKTVYYTEEDLDWRSTLIIMRVAYYFKVPDPKWSLIRVARVAVVT